MAFLTEAANRGSISTGYDIDYSLKLEPDNSESLTYTGTQSSAGNAKTWTWSGWIKRTELDAHTYLFSAGYSGFQFMGTENWLRLELYNGSTTYYLDLDMTFRDTSAWYHIVGQVDTTQATAADRVKIWINGVLQTEFRSSTNYTNISQNAEFQIGKTGSSANWLKVGDWFAGGRYLAAYIAEWHFTDGVVNDADAFGEFDASGIWKPKEYAGSYGTNGFYLDFSDSANLGDDANGSFSFSEGNITAADQATDTPTNNFAIINTSQGNSSKLTITEGATKIVKSGNHGWQTTNANIAVSVGKWYAEFKLDTSCTLVMLGVNQADSEVAWNGSHIGAYSNSTAQGMGYYSQNGYFYRNGGSGAIGSTYTAGDIIGIAFCYNSNGTAFMGMSKNGTWQNSQDPSSGTTNMLGLNYGNALPANTFYTFAISTHESAGGVLANFGGYPGFTISSANTDADGYGSFEYAVPTGYYALCTKNLAEYG